MRRKAAVASARDTIEDHLALTYRAYAVSNFGPPSREHCKRLAGIWDFHDLAKNENSRPG